MQIQGPIRPPPRRWHDGIPPAFLVALAIMVGGGALVGFAWAHGATEVPIHADRGQQSWFFHFARYGHNLVDPGLSLATSALMMLGFRELARRAGPGHDGFVLRVGVAAVSVIFFAVVVSLYMNHWYFPRHPAGGRELARDFWLWKQRVVCGGALVATGSLLFAGRKLFIVQALAMPFLIVTLFAFPVRSVWVLFRDELWFGVFIDMIVDVGFAAMMVLTLSALGRALPPAPVDVARAGEGLQRVGSALLARVLVLAVGAFMAVVTVPSHSVGLARLLASVFPAFLLLATVALITGLFQAAGLSAPRAPRLRLYAAGACTILAFTAEGIRALALYNVLALGSDSASRDHAAGLLEVLPYGIPALALAGLLLLLSAVDAMRRWAPEARTDRQMVVNAAVAVTMFSIAAVVLLREASAARSDIGFFILISILVMIANVIAHISVARVCHRVAEEMREAPALPTAVIAPPRP